MKFSVVIPARNEEQFLPACLESIRAAAAFHSCDVETIVVLDRCTDGTERIARAFGALVANCDAKNLAMIRNAGARAATHETLLTIDADSTMSANMFAEIDAALSTGRFIGGGVRIYPTRYSLGILVSLLLILGATVFRYRIAAGLFWCFRNDFEALGGFDESLIIAEDIDFALRLKALGRARCRRFGTLRRASIRTSTRKFDHFGDWFLVRYVLTHPRLLASGFKSGNRALADSMFYDFPR